MRRIGFGLFTAVLIAIALSPPTEAFPGGEFGVHIATLCIGIVAFTCCWFFRGNRGMIIGFAIAISTVMGLLWSVYFDAHSPLQLVALDLALVIAPCDGGCGMARAEFLHTVLSAMCASSILVPLFLFISRTKKSNRI